MPVPRRSAKWIWAGRIVALCCIAVLVAYLVMVGLDKADKVASTVSVVLALLALVAPYVLPPPSGPGTDSPPSTEPVNPRIDLRHAQGVQYNQGDGNVQNNNFGGSP